MTKLEYEIKKVSDALEQATRTQVDLQKELDSLKESLKSSQLDPVLWVPEYGDKYWVLKANGRTMDMSWCGTSEEVRALAIGNVYRTQEEAEDALEKLKVRHELEVLAAKSWEGKDRTTASTSIISWAKGSDHSTADYLSGGVTDSPQFYTNKQAREAIEAIGESRLRVYFGVDRWES